MRWTFPLASLVLCAAASPALAVQPYGATAQVSGISCRSFSLSGNMQSSAAFINTSRAFSAVARLSSSKTGDAVQEAVSADRMAAPYAALDRLGGAGAAAVIGAGTGSAGQLLATASTAIGKTFDAFDVQATASDDVALGPYSGMRCSFAYTLTAWVSPSAPPATVALSSITYGPVGARRTQGVRAVPAVASGRGFVQESGTLIFEYTNPTPVRAVGFGGIKAWAGSSDAGPRP
jgi:hypothetical protein